MSAQAAYEAYRDQMERSFAYAHPLPGWGDLPDGAHRAWEAAIAARPRDTTADELLDWASTLINHEDTEAQEWLSAYKATPRQPQPAPATADGQAAPELRAAMAETRQARDVVRKLLGLFDAADHRRMRSASVSARTLERYADEAGLPPHDALEQIARGADPQAANIAKRALEGK